MPSKSAWYLQASLPALLRHARTPYGNAMRTALEAAGYDDIPKNGLYVIGGMALGADDFPLGQLIEDLRISKQSAGQLVDALFTRGYLDRSVDELDRRRLVVRLTDRGWAAAAVQTRAREQVDAALARKLGRAGVESLRRGLATLIGLGREEGKK